jgi:hypothetical protein
MLEFLTFPNAAKRPICPHRMWSAAQDNELSQQIEQFNKIINVRFIKDEGPLGTLEAFANGKHSPMVGGPFPILPGPKGVKNWRHTGQEEFYGVFPEQDAAGNWLSVPYTPSEDGLQYTHRNFIDFLTTWGGAHNILLPKLVVKQVPKSEAQRLFVGNGPSAPYPIARVSWQNDGRTLVTTWSPKMGVRISRSTGEIKFHDIEEYKATYPLELNPVVKPIGSMTVKQTLDQTQAYLDSGLNDNEKYAEIKALY